MSESLEGIEYIDSIASKPNLDAIMVGPYDLSASMNLTGKFTNPKFKSALHKIKKLCKQYKIPCGIHAIEPNYKIVKKFIKDGYQFIPFAADTILLNLAIKSSFEKK